MKQRQLIASIAAAAVMSIALAPQPAGAAQVLYGAGGSTGTPSILYTIDASTGAATSVGVIGFNAVNSIDFDPLNGVLYGIANGGSSPSSLIKINTTTGAGTLVHTLSPSFQAPDMSFNSAGTLYTWDTRSGVNELTTVNLATGVTTDVGPSGLTTGTIGLGVNSAGKIYLKNGAGGHPAFDNKIYTINPSTGVATFVANTKAGFDNVLAFNSSDIAYTVDRIPPPCGGNAGAVCTDSILYKLDVTTGAATKIGPTGVSTLSALAFTPVVAPVIPEPETYSMLMAGLGLLGFVARRKKRLQGSATA
jgi:PEP-CTERM motif